MKENRKQEIITYSIMLAMGIIFYLLPGEWTSIEADTVRYLEEGGEGVLPGYPAFLMVFKSIFSEEYFLNAVVIVQSLLAVVCTFLFVLVLKKEFALKGWECILLYLLSMLPFSIYLPEVGITHQILTEGISYSIFYLFFIMVMKTIWSLQYKWYAGSVLTAILLGLIRIQMLFLMIICAILLGWIIFKRFGGKALCKIGVCFLALAVGFILLLGQKILNGFSQFSTVIMARGFYEADEEDISLFDDAMMQEIFAETYKLADEGESRYVYAEPGLYIWQSLVHDRMNIYALQAIEGYDEKHPEERIRAQESIFFELGFKVMLKHFDRYLYHTIRLMLPSFIATVFFQIKPIYLLCHFIALFIYLFAIFGSVIVGRKGGDRRVVEMSSAIVCILIVMVVGVNMLFIGLQRYMVYGMGIFYCAMYLLCKEMGKCLLQKSAGKIKNFM
ncbi:MAG: hypothetical protein NC400_00740 [Clostridium sp.]|nr:hypothetical protein [Clostridium sp.]